MQRKIYDDTADIDNKHTKNYIKRGRRVTTGGTLSSGLRDIFVYFFLREILLTPWDLLPLVNTSSYIYYSELTSPDSALLEEERR